MTKNNFNTVMEAVERLLSADGFAVSKRGVFTRQTFGDWYAWIGITGNSFMLSPIVGVFNRELIDIAARAFEILGRKRDIQFDGPPLIMANLESLAPSNTSCSQDAEWHYVGVALTEEAATELVACLRKHAYPFCESHTSLDSIVDAAKSGMGGFSLPSFLPIILTKLGLSNELNAYVDNRIMKVGDAKLAQEYLDYVKTVIEIAS